MLLLKENKWEQILILYDIVFPEKQGDFTSISHNILTDDSLFILLLYAYFRIFFFVSLNDIWTCKRVMHPAKES